MILGFAFLGASLVWGAVTFEETRLTGGVGWSCDPPEEATGQTWCGTRQNDATFLDLNLSSVLSSLWLAFMGIGCLIAAVAVCPRAPQAYSPAAPPHLATSGGPVPPAPSPGPRQQPPGPGGPLWAS
jgi:hypothetical protein